VRGATCDAMCRPVDIVGSFKLPSVDVRLGANDAPGNAVRVRRSSSVNKGGRTLKIRLRMDIVVQMCSVLFLTACGRIVFL